MTSSTHANIARQERLEVRKKLHIWTRQPLECIDLGWSSPVKIFINKGILFTNFGQDNEREEEKKNSKLIVKIINSTPKLKQKKGIIKTNRRSPARGAKRKQGIPTGKKARSVRVERVAVMLQTDAFHPVIHGITSYLPPFFCCILCSMGISCQSQKLKGFFRVTKTPLGFVWRLEWFRALRGVTFPFHLF